MNHSEKSHSTGQSPIAFIPIKPVFADRILSGEKKFEFRKTRIRESSSHFIVYASSPTKKIIAVAKIKKILTGSPSAVWEQTKHAAGITRKLYRTYFKGAKKAHAIEISEVLPLRVPLKPNDVHNGFKVPQSFCYVDQAFFDKVMQMVQPSPLF